MDDLFRKEAVEHFADRLTGDVILAVPLSHRIWSYLLAAIILLTLLFATFASYARHEMAVGWIVPHEGIVKLGARANGTITDIFVHEGDIVAKGAPIARIKSSGSLAAGGDTGRQLDAALTRQERALQDVGVTTDAKMEATRQGLVDREKQLNEQLAQATFSVKLSERQVQLAKNDYSRYQRLVSAGAISASLAEEHEGNVLSAEQTLAQQNETALQLKQQISDADTQLHTLQQDRAADRATNQSDLAQIAERKITSSSDATDVLLASVSGRVLSLPVVLGQSVSASSTVAVMAPGHSHLEAELYVPSRALGSVKVGDPVRLMFEAFPYEEFGSRQAKISWISDAIVSPSDVTVPGLTLSGPAFRVRATIESGFVRAYRKNIPIQPEMLLTARIKTADRSLVRWLFDPLFAAQK